MIEIDSMKEKLSMLELEDLKIVIDCLKESNRSHLTSLTRNIEFLDIIYEEIPEKYSMYVEKFSKEFPEDFSDIRNFSDTFSKSYDKIDKDVLIKLNLFKTDLITALSKGNEYFYEYYLRNRKDNYYNTVVELDKKIEMIFRVINNFNDKNKKDFDLNELCVFMEVNKYYE